MGRVPSRIGGHDDASLHQGMPRRYYAYLPEYEVMHEVSTVGAWILMVGLFVVLFT